MTQVKMPEPMAFRWRVPIVDSDGRQRGESDWKLGTEKVGLPWWSRDSLITTTQAEAYADERVREALVLAGPALQSQDAEEAARFRFCLEHGFPQKWEEGVRGNLRVFWTSRPGSKEEFSSAIEAIDHARRVMENKS